MPTRPSRPGCETLFSLRRPALLGRRLPGLPEVTARAGPYHCPVVFTGSGSNAVSGIRLTLTAAELAQADAYEADANYRRTRVRLGSGAEAWVYICPTRTSENG